MSESAGEKTEQPTGKRLRDARKKGQSVKSQDLSSALLLLAAVGVLWFAGGFLARFAVNSIKQQFVYAASFKGDFTNIQVFEALSKGLISFAAILAPLFLVIWVLAFVINYLQVGSIFASGALKPKFSKLNPAEGFKNRFFKLRSYVELSKTLVKIIVMAAIAASAMWSAKSDLVLLSSQPIDISVLYAFGLIVEIGFKTGIAFLILGVLDFVLQRYLNMRDLRMTKHEVREEFKETEGNPLVKARRKALHRELLEQGIVSAIQGADVVVANPTHIAVALQYRKVEGGAPRVVAKGADLMAAQIRKLARESSIPITRDISLARALFEVELDHEIPEELYEAVAVVLRWVYAESESGNTQKMQLGVVNG